VGPAIKKPDGRKSVGIIDLPQVLGANSRRQKLGLDKMIVAYNKTKLYAAFFPNSFYVINLTHITKQRHHNILTNCIQA